MTKEVLFLALTAVSIGFFHTLFGPDHYVPFITIAKARKWSYHKTMLVTFLCGIGHVGSSVVLGLLGVCFGFALQSLEFIESMRGNWAAWTLICFGLIYFIYGMRQAFISKPHSHHHSHVDGEVHSHEHIHHGGHSHVHQKHASFQWTPWALFVIFVFGPCEPLIPLLMYPAAQHSMQGVIVVTLLFSIATIGTMMSVVSGVLYGINFLPMKKIERFGHVFAGSAILLCGCAIVFLGL